MARRMRAELDSLVTEGADFAAVRHIRPVMKGLPMKSLGRNTVAVNPARSRTGKASVRKSRNPSSKVITTLREPGAASPDGSPSQLDRL